MRARDAQWRGPQLLRLSSTPNVPYSGDLWGWWGVCMCVCVGGGGIKGRGSLIAASVSLARVHDVSVWTVRSLTTGVTNCFT